MAGFLMGERMDAERIDVVESENDGNAVFEARIIVEFTSMEEAEFFAEEFMARGMLGLMDFQLPSMHWCGLQFYYFYLELDMPKVGGRHFAYTKKGKAAAKKYAKKSGKKIKKKKKAWLINGSYF